MKSDTKIQDIIPSADTYQRYSYRACITISDQSVHSELTASGVFPSPKQTVSVGGFSWYLGEVSENCNEVCADFGGYDSATMTYAGGNGRVAEAQVSNCKAILNDFWAPKKAVGSVRTINHASGCYVYPRSGERYIGYLDTSATSYQEGARRVCACTN
jgi:hypothetical protein